MGVRYIIAKKDGIEHFIGRDSFQYSKKLEEAGFIVELLRHSEYTRRMEERGELNEQKIDE
jgi:hypothetical protein